MASFQNIEIIGNLGRDPEMRYTPAGRAVTNFSVAVNRKWTDDNGATHEEVTWFRVSTWGKTAENCNQYLSKGREVFVTGRLITDPATGGPKVYQRNDGSTGASFEINAFQVIFLGGAQSGNGQSHDQFQPTEEDIPF